MNALNLIRLVIALIVLVILVDLVWDKVTIIPITVHMPALRNIWLSGAVCNA